MSVAQNYVEQLRSRDSSLSTELAVRVDEHGEAGTAGIYQRSALVSNDTPTLQRVTVQVDYPGARTPVELTRASDRVNDVLPPTVLNEPP